MQDIRKHIETHISSCTTCSTTTAQLPDPIDENNRKCSWVETLATCMSSEIVPSHTKSTYTCDDRIERVKSIVCFLGLANEQENAMHLVHDENRFMQIADNLLDLLSVSTTSSNAIATTTELLTDIGNIHQDIFSQPVVLFPTDVLRSSNHIPDDVPGLEAEIDRIKAKLENHQSKLNELKKDDDVEKSNDDHECVEELRSQLEQLEKGVEYFNNISEKKYIPFCSTHEDPSSSTVLGVLAKQTDDMHEELVEAVDEIKRLQENLIRLSKDGELANDVNELGDKCIYDEQGNKIDTWNSILKKSLVRERTST